MKRARPAQAGVTLIEMLVALSISAMIGLAGFVLLDSITRTETGVAGRLEKLKQQDRAFQLFTRDLDHAHVAVLDGDLELHMAGRIITWRVSEAGVVRRIGFVDRPAIEQRVLDGPATLTSINPGTVTLTLSASGFARRAILPTGHVP
ncbi:MAG: prepilin-type N-terminal cleavage/methylation domain-containing protein [Pseudomonadota bacterium]